MAQHRITAFTEADVRPHVVFQARGPKRSDTKVGIYGQRDGTCKLLLLLGSFTNACRSASDGAAACLPHSYQLQLWGPLVAGKLAILLLLLWFPFDCRSAS
jgi:hypothetical protein